MSTKPQKSQDKKLQELNRELEEKIKELDYSAKLLVRRDLELTESNLQLQELDRVKSEFISIAAHQLRTPTAAIKWIVQSLLEDEPASLTPEQRTSLLRIREVNERMINLVDQLLSVARIEEGRMLYAFAPINLWNVLETVLTELDHDLKMRKIKIEIPPRTKLPKVRADEEKIRFTLRNLIENAIHYNKNGGSIRIQINKMDAFLQIDISDEGIGIPEKEQGRVFTRFFRAENAIRTQTAGSGLGLFVAKNIVEAHGGKIWFVSREDEGSTFSFTLPLA